MKARIKIVLSVHNWKEKYDFTWNISAEDGLTIIYL